MDVLWYSIVLVVHADVVEQQHYDTADQQVLTAKEGWVQSMCLHCTTQDK